MMTTEGEFTASGFSKSVRVNVTPHQHDQAVRLAAKTGFPLSRVWRESLCRGFNEASRSLRLEVNRAALAENARIEKANREARARAITGL